MSLESFWRSALDPLRVMGVRMRHWKGDTWNEREDHLTIEEPCEIRINHSSLAVIMRTPGHDHELALGFLLSEGVIHTREEIIAVEDACDEDGLPLANVVNVTLLSPTHERNGPERHGRFERHFAVSSSCGLCGKNSIADVMVDVEPLPRDAVYIPAAVLYTLPAQLRGGQDVFTHTGGLHAAGLFDVDGRLRLLREDVGRHNAIDKLIGHGLLHGTFPFSGTILMVSGRTSFEIVQKALLARIPCVAAISAPSSLAVELAEEGGITLIGFLRERSMNVYTHPERVV